MADSILKLKVESQEYDAKLKRAAQGLQQYADQCRKAGGTMEVVEKDTLDFIKAIGRMETVNRTAKGSVNEMTQSFTQLSMIYKKMSDSAKSSPAGKALADSLDVLKSRIKETKKEIQNINNELNGSKFGQFGSILDGIGQKMGVNANITELLTSKTALMTAGIGAATAVIGKATQEWAKYNAELAKQDQITTVTTGLKGAGADRMTDQARALVDTYNVDFRDAINAANTLMSQFGKTGDESIQLLRDGMRGMIQGDGPKLLSMIQQFAPSFRDAGVSASQLIAVIQNSEGGIFTDQNMNAIVMGIKNIRLMTDATSKALAKLGIDGEDMTRKLNDGSMTIFEAMQKVSTAINGASSASQAAGEVMQQVFGRQGAASGMKLGEAIATLNTNLEETKRQTGELGDAYDDLYEANVKLNGAIRDCFEYDGWEQMATGIKANLVSALASVLDYLGKIKGALGGFSVTQQQGDTRNGGSAFIDRAIARLGDGKSQGQKAIYQKQIGAYTNQIFNINDQITELQRKAGEDMDGNMAVNYEKQIRNLEARKEAIKRNMDEYDRRAQAVFAGAVTPPQTNPIVSQPKNQKGGSKTPKTEEQLNNENIQKLTYEYQKLATAEKTATEAQIKDIGVRKSAIENEIARLQDRNKELALFAEEAQGKRFNDGSLPALIQQLKDLQTAASQAANGREWEDYQKKIETITNKINVLKGVLPKDQQATFTVGVNAEQLEQLRMLLPTEDQTIRINVEEGRVDLPKVPTEDETIRVNVEQGQVNLPKVPSEDETIKVNVEQGNVDLPNVPTDDKTVKVNVKPGEVDLPKVPTDETIRVNVEEGRVNLPKVPTDDETIKVNVEQGNVDLPKIPTNDETIRVNITANTADAMKAVRDLVGEIDGINADVKIEAKAEVNEQDIRTSFERLQDSIRLDISSKNIDVDKNTLKSLTEVVTKYDIKTGNIDMQSILAQTDALTESGMSAGKAYAKALQDAISQNIDLSALQEKIDDGINIPEETWLRLQDQINEQLKNLGIEPIKIDVKTGNLVSTGNETEKSWKAAASAVASVGSAMQSIEDPAAKVAGTVAQAIANIALGYSQAMLAPKDPVSWIAFGAAGLAQMLSMISTIHSSTGYAEGGIIKGNSYSGDNIGGMVDGSQFVGLNAGELVLNQAQQTTLAQNLQGGGMNGLNLHAVLTGENIVLSANRYLKRTGQGELVTWK